MMKDEDKTREQLINELVELRQRVAELEASETERKRAEEALRESEEKFRRVVEQSGDGIVLTDEQGTIIEWNRGEERITGLTRAEVLGQPLWDVMLRVTPEERRSLAMCEQLKALLLDFFRTGQAPWLNQLRESTIQRPDGTHRTIQQLVFPIKTDKGFMASSISRDITERKRAEEQIQASLREKEVLLKEIHHRVKNNLQVISSLLKWQSEYIEDKQSLEMFQESQNRIKSMALIHERLYQSKDLARIDFAEYIRNLAAHLFRSYKVSSSAITLKVGVDDVSLGVDAAIPCGLIINELVSNALKHAFPAGREGEICINLCADDGELTLIVSNNGVNFPEGLDFRNTESLGLHLVTTLTSQLEGTIELDRSSGTAFKIAFARPKH